MTSYIGIDPGLGGAAAQVYPDGGEPSVEDTPTVEVARGKGKSRIYVETLMVELIGHYEHISGGHVRALIERQGARPGEGVRSTFSSGYGYGLWIGILSALEIPWFQVEPRAWKKEMQATDDKNASRRRAMELFPAMASALSRVKDHGRAEALLIAEYARRKGL